MANFAESGVKLFAKRKVNFFLAGQFGKTPAVTSVTFDRSSTLKLVKGTLLPVNNIHQTYAFLLLFLIFKVSLKNVFTF